MILIDIFTYGNDVVYWLRDKNNKDIYKTQKYYPEIYFETFNNNFTKEILSFCKLQEVYMKHMTKGKIKVFKVTFPSIKSFRKDFPIVQKKLRNIGIFYNADISIPEKIMFKKDIYPLAEIENNKNVDDINKYDYHIPEFRIAKLKIRTEGVFLNDVLLSMNDFAKEFKELDPDIIFINGQQRELLYLAKRYKINLNRYGRNYFPEIKKHTFFSYGQAFYRETPIYLKGRLLLNSNSFSVDDFNIFSIMEGARICRMTIQRISNHSVGAAITNLLAYQASKDGYLIPYQTGVYEKIKPFRELVSCDRGAYTLEPEVGLHKNVAELDFVSMFPSIISRYNLSPETLGCKCCTKKIPQTNYNFCQKERGIVPKVCDFLIDRRLHFKKQKDYISKSKVGYLKWLLVVIFGFQSFRNKKIGCIEVHESINAVARFSLMQAIKLAEDRGYRVIHGIVDSMYMIKKDMSDVLDLEKEITQATGLPMEFKKIYRFMTFLPSVNKEYMPVPSSFYGVGEDGNIKVRGIELRSRNSPRIVKNLQKEIILEMEQVRGMSDMNDILKKSVKILQNHIKSLKNATLDDLYMKVRIGKEKYSVNCVQKVLLQRQKQKGVDIVPGETLRYVIENFPRKQYIEISDYRGVFDTEKYTNMLIKAFRRLFLPFDLSSINLDGSIQTKLKAYMFEENELVQAI